MRKSNIFLAFIILLSAAIIVEAAPNQPLVQLSDFSRVGAFKLPSGDNYYSYGALALSFYRDASGKKTLFLAGHDWYQKVGQVDVSGTPGTGSYASLPSAASLQTPVDVTEGKLGSVGYSTKVYGTLVYNGRLIIGASSSYDGSGLQTTSHGVSQGLTLSTSGDFNGFYAMAGSANPRSKGGYMTLVPPEWQSFLGGPALTGNCCLSIISATSSGPAANVFNPDQVGQTTPIPATTLVYYPLSNPVPGGGCTIQSNIFNCATRVNGIIFPDGTNSVLFFGTHGTGPICYKGDKPGCPDNGGYNAPPYRAQVWAYDANDFLAVKNGQKQAWQIQPYAVWDITSLVGGNVDVKGAAYDPVDKRIYVTAFSNNEEPVVQVLKLNVGTSTNPLPTVAISANPTSIASGASSILSWTSINSNSCTASGAWSGSKQTSGTESVSPLTTSTYSIACTGPGGQSSTQSATVTVTPADTTAPTRTGASPSGSLAVGTTSTTISLTTNEAATCRYSIFANTAYSSMASTFTTTTGTSHSAAIAGLANGQTYNYYVRCVDNAGNANTNDYPIAFSVAALVVDTTPPTFSAVAASAAQNTATITWTTNEASDTQVEYGTTTGYGSSTALNTAMVTSHSQSITGLSAGILYHYRVKSKDAAGNLATSGDYTFTTISAGGNPQAQPLVQQSNLVYEGAFRLPSSDTMTYGGSSLAYNPSSNSLFLVGHIQQQLTVEVSIPPVVNSANINSLNTATLIQSFTDATEGKKSQIDPGEPNAQYIGGQLVYNNKLYLGVYNYYDGDVTQSKSHFARPLSLSTKGQVLGPYKVGTQYPGFVDGYMGTIPSEWQSLFGGPAMTGGCCFAIISAQSSGPAVSVFDPADLGVKNPVPATPLVGYPMEHSTLGTWNHNTVTQYYGLSDEVKGVVFPAGTRSVLFFGRHGTTACYGTGTECNDPDFSSDKGTHGYPYLYYVWAYDANDLLAVKNGQKQQWEIIPYAVWSLNLPFVGTKGAGIGGAAYDPATQRIYIVQRYSSDSSRYAMPLVHVYKVNVGSSSTLPTVSIIANPTSITSGSSSTLTWSASNANSCTASGAWSGTKQVSSSQVVSPLTTSTYNLTCTGTGGSAMQSATVTVTPAADTTPPTFSTIAASAAQNTATVTWTTNEASDTQVEYGPTTSYGSSTALNTAMMTSHSVSLTGLSAGTLYHYRVKSKDAAGNLATSGDYTFTTVAVSVWKPQPMTTWQWQLTGTVDESFNVQVYDIDLFDVPASTIGRLKSSGKKVICYMSAGSYENWRSDASSFPSSVLGNNLDGWAGERWLDIRQTSILSPIMAARMDLAVQKGCDAIEPDNVDGYTNNPGFPLTAAHQLAYNRMLADLAHQRGLSIGLKNDLDQISDLVNSFDFAINEQCNQFNECDALVPFINAGKAVFNAEYQGNTNVFCPYMNNLRISSIKKNIDLNAQMTACWDVANTVPPTISFSASPQSITSGSSSTLTWSSTNANSCTASGAWSGGKGVGSSEVVSPVVNSSYTLTCNGPGGQASQVVSVVVNPAPSGGVLSCGSACNGCSDRILAPSGCSLSQQCDGTNTVHDIKLSASAVTAGSALTVTLDYACWTPDEDNLALWYYDGTSWSLVKSWTKQLTGCDTVGDGRDGSVSVTFTPTSRVGTHYVRGILAAPDTSLASAGACSALAWGDRDDMAFSVTSGPVDPAPIVSISANPTSITTGQSSTLTWSASNANSCTASGAWSGTKQITSSQSVSPLTTSTYNLTCTGTGGSVMQSVTVSVTSVPAPTVILNANPTSIAIGASSTLTWSASNANSCTASGAWSGTKQVSSSQVVSPLTTSTYNLTCTGTGGTTMVSRTVTVLPLPIVSINAVPSSITRGSSSVLSWSSTHATSCTASGSWSGSKNTVGTQTVSPISNATYNLTCTGSGGSTMQSALIVVTEASVPAPTVTFNAAPGTINRGESSTLTWSSTNANTCTASGGWNGNNQTSGSQVVSPNSNSSYTLTCNGAGGSAAKVVSVVVIEDVDAPFRRTGMPNGMLASGTTSATLSLSTDESATCKYSTTANTAYNSMSGTFTTSGASSHSSVVSGLVDGGSYNYYVRCIDSLGNVNLDDFAISFRISDNSHADRDDDGVPDDVDKCDKPGLGLGRVNRFGCPLPVHSKFTLNLTTNFSDVDLTDFTGFKIGIVGLGQIVFGNGHHFKLLDGNNDAIDLDSLIDFQNGRVVVNSAGLAALNQSATVWLYGLSTINNPVVKRNGVICTDCRILSFTKPDISFTVPHFSDYSVEEGSYCGDGLCSASETCTVCSSDCGACPATSSGGRGGGGGGGSSSRSSTISCTGVWTCSDWGLCMNGAQKRSCVFGKVASYTLPITSTCPKATDKLALSQACSVAPAREPVVEPSSEPALEPVVEPELEPVVEPVVVEVENGVLQPALFIGGAIVALAAIILLAIFGLRYYSSNAPGAGQKDIGSDEQLGAYVGSMRKAGKGDDAIKSELKKAGWQDNSIDKVMKKKP